MLFVVDPRYVVSLDDINVALDPHVVFLERNFAAGHFIVSGPKVPRTGGVIIATVASRSDLDSILDQDPFKQQGLAQYTITEFRPSKMADALQI